MSTPASFPAKKTLIPFTELVGNNPVPFVAAAATVAMGFAAFWYLMKNEQQAEPASPGSPKKIVALKGPKEVLHCKLVKRIETSHNTVILRFALPSGSNCLGLGAGKHISIATGIKGDEKNPEVRRSYTPISTDNEQLVNFEGNTFDVLIKVYNKCEKFPKGGVCSQRLGALEPGDSIRMFGPTGLFQYLGNGEITRKPGGDVRKVKKIALIAGGTGITPMLQIMKHVAESEGRDTTEISLLYANSTVDDVLLYEELRDFGALKGFNVWFTVSQEPAANRRVADDSLAPATWPFSIGRINKEMVEKHLPAGSPDTVALLCGPAGMINETCKPLLKDAGYADSDMIVL